MQARTHHEQRRARHNRFGMRLRRSEAKRGEARRGESDQEKGRPPMNRGSIKRRETVRARPSLPTTHPTVKQLQALSQTLLDGLRLLHQLLHVNLHPVEDVLLGCNATQRTHSSATAPASTTTTSTRDPTAQGRSTRLEPSSRSSFATPGRVTGVYYISHI